MIYFNSNRHWRVCGSIQYILGKNLCFAFPGGEFSLDELLPKMIRTEAQQRVIDSLTEEDNPVLIKYVFNDKE